MPYKNRKSQLAAQAQHYQENKATYQERSRQRKIAIRTWLREYKTGLKCELCSECRAAALTFHHKDPARKEINISKTISNRWGKKRILKEIGKCQVLCSNCHLCLHDDEHKNSVNLNRDQCVSQQAERRKP